MSGTNFWRRIKVVGAVLRGGRGQGLDGQMRRARKARKAFRKSTREASAPVVDDASGWRGRTRNEEGQL